MSAGSEEAEEEEDWGKEPPSLCALTAESHSPASAPPLNAALEVKEDRETERTPSDRKMAPPLPAAVLESKVQSETVMEAVTP